MEKSEYERLDIPTVVNAAGHLTRLGGTRIREEAVEAMKNASQSFARISDLQSRASELISEVTGSEAGYITCSASSGLTLGTAACIAGDDLSVMDSLPDTTGISDELLMAKAHRNIYDHNFRASGARIVEFGLNHVVTGLEDVKEWQIEQAITDNTIGIAYMAQPRNQLSLSTVVNVANDYDIPVIVDAAAQLPPVENLTHFIEEGADLVAFSGGKEVRGPQTTGFLAGRQDLIRSVALQHLDMSIAEPFWNLPENLVGNAEIKGVPNNGLGRSMKTGKEEIIGLLKALELFIEEDHDELKAEWMERNEIVASNLRSIEGFDVMIQDPKKNEIPQVIVNVDESVTGMSVKDLVQALISEEPRVEVRCFDGHLKNEMFTVNPFSLTNDEAQYVADRIVANMSN